ncbi:MAG: GNAT family N-acetyltransferase [Thermoguttaceae bacterium]
MDLTIDVLCTIEQIEAFVPEWLAFLETAPLGISVYNDPRYILAQLQYNSRNDATSRTLHFVIVRENGKIRCIAPLSIRDHKFRLEIVVKKLFPIKIRQMQVFGESFIYANNTDCQKCFELVFEELKKHRVRFDILYIMDFRCNSPFWEFCFSYVGKLGFLYIDVLAEKQSDILIHLPDVPEKILSSLNSKQRYNVKRLLNYFETKIPQHEIIKVTRSDQIEYFFDCVQQISDNSWQSKTFGKSQWKTESRIQSWKKIADEGFLYAHILLAKGLPIAYRNAYKYADCYFAQESRFDQNYVEVTPGMVLLYRTLEDLVQTGSAKVLDFGFGTLGNKKLFGNEEIESMTVFITGSWKGRQLARMQHTVNRLVLWCKKISQRLGITARIRKFLHHKK